jgi:uncharacterized protein (TIGR02117 family)
MSRWSVSLFCSALTACAQQPVCDATRTLYVVSHGWHSGIVVERADLAKRLPALALGEGSLVEIGWGEERFYQARAATLGMALRAVLQPNASVLQVVPFAGSPRGYFAGSEVAEVRTDEAGYTAAVDFIAATFKPPLERLGPSQYGAGWFYRAEGSFHLFKTCNTWVSDVLERAQCPSASRATRPPPSRGSSSRPPPWARATRSTIARPSPAPPRPLRAASSRVKGRFSRSVSLAGIPGPRSRTSMTAPLGVLLNSISIGSPAYRTALSSRLLTARRTAMRAKRRGRVFSFFREMALPRRV